jgi:lipopolysaccharide export LptBFGC system permease protein LptF
MDRHTFIRLVLIPGGIVVVSFLVVAFILNVVLSSLPVSIGLPLAIVLLVVLVLGVVLLMRDDRRKHRWGARGHSEEEATDQTRF